MYCWFPYKSTNLSYLRHTFRQFSSDYVSVSFILIMELLEGVSMVYGDSYQPLPYFPDFSTQLFLVLP